MAFIKGQSGNPGGRKKGTKNKTSTTDLRLWINQFIDDNRAQLQKDWKALEPKERVILFEKLLKYSLPTLQATTLTTDFDRMSEPELDEVVQKLLTSLN